MSGGFFIRKKPSKSDVFRAQVSRNWHEQDRRAVTVASLGAFLVISLALADFEPLFRQTAPQDYAIAVNQVAREEWRAEFPFESFDVNATNKARDEAAAKVLDVYTIRLLNRDTQLRALDTRFEALRGHRDEVDRIVREALLASDSSEDAQTVMLEALTAFAQRLVLEPAFAGVEDPASIALFLMPAASATPQRVFASGPEDAVRPVASLAEPELKPLEFAHAGQISAWGRKGLELVLHFGVLENRDDLAADPEKKVSIDRPRAVGEIPQEQEIALADIPGVESARENLRLRIHQDASGRTPAPEGAAAATAAGTDVTRLQTAAHDLAQAFVAPTLFLSPEQTGMRRSRARAEVASVKRFVERGEVMQNEGDRWTEQSVQDVSTYLQKMQTGTERQTSMAVTMAAHMVLTGLLLLALVRSLPLLLHRNQDRRKSLEVCLLVIAGAIVAGRIASYFDATGYVVPVAAAAILLAILTNARVAALAGATMAVLLSVQYGYDWGLLVVSGAMAMAGAMSVTVVRRRSDMARAALHATLIGALTTLSITLASEGLDLSSLSRNVMMIALNGGASLFIVPGLLPPLERMLGIITDIQLLEYSDLNNEILSRLAIEVPATYSHSLMLGQLAEAACEAIGANGLLARVSAYYHDIGKIRRPEYFIENQTGVNIHDGLSPRLSARAIASHVIEGAEMARELHLPKPIIDGIQEHHGTCLIGFFYKLAQDNAKHGDVSEKDFRYPGPKPQSRETAVLMICDAIESGVRSIKNPNEERVREFVDRIINARATDRQFDECDLTLRDLDIISEVVARRILSTMHTRIAYPPQKAERPAANVIAMPGGGE